MSLSFDGYRKIHDSRAIRAGIFLWEQNISNMVLVISISTKRGDEAVEDLCERITTHGVAWILGVCRSQEVNR